MTCGEAMIIGRKLRFSTVTSLVVLVAAGLGIATLAGSPAFIEKVRLPAAFADSVSDSGGYYPYARVGDTYWIGLLVMPVQLAIPIRITGVQVNGHVAGATFAFYDMELFGVNQGRHVDFLRDRSLHEGDYHVGPRLIGTVFRPGKPTHYGIIRMTLTRPGSYDIESITLDYKSFSGASGSQDVVQSVRIAMCGDQCPPPNS